MTPADPEPELPPPLATRVIDRVPDVRLMLDDDRGAQRLSVAAGGLATVGVAASVWGLSTSWSWLAVGTVPFLGLLAAIACGWLGHRSVEVTLLDDALGLPEGSVPYADVSGVDLVDGFVAVRTPTGVHRIPVHGESTAVQDALVSHLRARTVDA